MSPGEFSWPLSAATSDSGAVRIGGKGCYQNLVGWRPVEEGGVKGVEADLLTDPSAFALRRIRWPYLLAIL